MSLCRLDTVLVSDGFHNPTQTHVRTATPIVVDGSEAAGHDLPSGSGSERTRFDAKLKSGKQVRQDGGASSIDPLGTTDSDYYLFFFKL